MTKFKNPDIVRVSASQVGDLTFPPANGLAVADHPRHELHPVVVLDDQPPLIGLVGQVFWTGEWVRHHLPHEELPIATWRDIGWGVGLVHTPGRVPGGLWGLHFPGAPVALVVDVVDDLGDQGRRAASPRGPKALPKRLPTGRATLASPDKLYCARATNRVGAGGMGDNIQAFKSEANSAGQRVRVVEEGPEEREAIGGPVVLQKLVELEGGIPSHNEIVMILKRSAISRVREGMIASEECRTCDG